MRIKRLTLTLPARMKDTAHHDARAIADAVARQVHKNGGQVAAVSLRGHGHTGSVLAQRVGAALPKGTGGHGHGS